jgi:CRP/FNR family transcriptional regulator, cyclic AMP receptor protein
MTNEEALAHVELFAGLDKKELHSLAQSCKERTYSPGSVLIEQGNTGAGLYVLTRGHVRITQANDPDRAEEEIATAGPGDVLGEMALLDDLPRSATVTAIDDVTALLLPVWEFRGVLRNNPDIALHLLGVLSRRLRQAENRSHNQ